MGVSYEWDIERFNLDSEDIEEHDFRERLHDFGAERLTHAVCEDTDPDDPACGLRLVLVRHTGNQIEGITDTLWAYVEDGKLPAYFTDSTNSETSVRVPQRFHREFNL